MPVHQLQGELAISVPRHSHLRATITAGKGWFPYFCGEKGSFIRNAKHVKGT